MTRGIASGESVTCHGLLNDQPFPAFPFTDRCWLGFVFNRDLHGAAGVPRDVFEAVLESVKSRGGTALKFVSAVTLLDGAPNFPSTDLNSWDEYLNFVRSIEFCPEYYLVSADGAALFWFDPDAVVVGGAPDVMRSAAGFLGGVGNVMRRSADEFGVSVSDAGSDVAAYIRCLASSLYMDSSPLPSAFFDPG